MVNDHSKHTHTAAQHFPEYRRGDGKVIYNREIGGEETVNEGYIPPGPARIVQHYVGHDGIPTSVIERDGKTDIHRATDQPSYWPVNDPARIKWDLTAEAEHLATSTEWKTTGDRLNSMADTWKRTTADRSTESVLGAPGSAGCAPPGVGSSGGVGVVGDEVGGAQQVGGLVVARSRGVRQRVVPERRLTDKRLTGGIQPRLARVVVERVYGRHSMSVVATRR